MEISTRAGWRLRAYGTHTIWTKGIVSMMELLKGQEPVFRQLTGWKRMHIDAIPEILGGNGLQPLLILEPRERLVQTVTGWRLANGKPT